MDWRCIRWMMDRVEVALVNGHEEDRRVLGCFPLTALFAY